MLKLHDRALHNHAIAQIARLCSTSTCSCVCQDIMSKKVKPERERFSIDLIFSPKGEWATPGGTAIPGRPVAKVEQAPDTSPKFKNQFNIEAPG